MGNTDPLNPKQVIQLDHESRSSSHFNNDKSNRSSFNLLDVDEINLLIKEARFNLRLRNKLIQDIYTHDQIKNVVRNTLSNVGCPSQDYQDHFNEAIVNFIKACYKPDFEIKTNLSNYMAGIAKNLWFKEVTKRKDGSTILLNNMVYQNDTESIEMVLIEGEKKKLIRELLDYLDATCRRVLTLWSLNKRMREIANKLNYKSEGMARKKKHHCLRKLYRILDEHPAFVKQLRH